MYEKVEKENVLEEMSNNSGMVLVDFATKRILDCDEMMLNAIRSFIDKPEAVFFKKVKDIG